MSEIEALHASIRRELVVLSTQVTSLGIQELSDRFALRCNRRHPAAYGVAAPTKVGVRPPATIAEHATVTEPQSKRRKGNVADGFKHFLHERTRGDPRGCAQPGLRAEYDALPEAERERHELGGKTSTRSLHT